VQSTAPALSERAGETLSWRQSMPLTVHGKPLATAWCSRSLIALRHPAHALECFARPRLPSPQGSWARARAQVAEFRKKDLALLGAFDAGAPALAAFLATAEALREDFDCAHVLDAALVPEARAAPAPRAARPCFVECFGSAIFTARRLLPCAAWRLLRKSCLYIASTNRIDALAVVPWAAGAAPRRSARMLVLRRWDEVLGFMQPISAISPCPASEQASRMGARLVDAQTRSAWSMGAEPSGACARRPRAVGQLSCCSSRTTSR